MVAAYKPQFTPISYDGIDSNTPSGELPELLDRHETRGGYDPRTGKLTPIKNISDDFDESLINELLDSMTFGPRILVADSVSTVSDRALYVLRAHSTFAMKSGTNRRYRPHWAHRLA